MHGRERSTDPQSESITSSGLQRHLASSRRFWEPACVRAALGCFGRFLLLCCSLLSFHYLFEFLIRMRIEEFRAPPHSHRQTVENSSAVLPTATEWIEIDRWSHTEAKVTGQPQL